MNTTDRPPLTAEAVLTWHLWPTRQRYARLTPAEREEVGREHRRLWNEGLADAESAAAGLNRRFNLGGTRP